MSRLIVIIGERGQLAHALKMVLNEDAITIGRSTVDATHQDALSHLLSKLKPRAIINAAAYTNVDQAESERKLALQLNCELPRHLALYCKQHAIPYFHYSTDYVFDGKKTSPYLESEATSPINHYGESKLQGEQEALATYPSSIVFRTSWIYSPWGHNFVKTMLRLAQEKKSVNVVTDQTGAPTYALDLAKATSLCLTHVLKNRLVLPGGIYHLTAQGSCSWFEFAQEIFQQAFTVGILSNKPDLHPILSQHFEQTAKRPQNSLLSNKKMNQLLDLQLPHWRDSLKHCIKAINENQSF